MHQLSFDAAKLQSPVCAASETHVKKVLAAGVLCRRTKNLSALGFAADTVLLTPLLAQKNNNLPA
jgi:hypothetical protein